MSSKLVRTAGGALLGMTLALGWTAVVRGATAVPRVPTVVSPADGASNVAANPILSWRAYGATSYDVYFGAVNPPPRVATLTTRSYAPATSPGKTYFWRVIAKNSAGTSQGPVWSFATASVAPPPPPVPPTISCPANQSGTATTSAGLTMSYPPPTVTGGAAPISVVTVPTSGSVFPVGTTTVTATATDTLLRQAACAFGVTVAAPPPPPPPTSSTDSAAYGLWTPAAKDTSTKAQHDAFSAIGPDGKRYPTWHPPTGPGGCTFGHEHGRDPAGSTLLADITGLYGGLLFGYANEELDVWNAAKGIADGMRHEDHVGHKVEWENNVTIYESTTTGGAARRALTVKCDFFMKIHQGTHSKDAFTNNMHELLYAMQCQDGPGGTIGSKVIVTKMVVFGEPGGFSEGSVAGGFSPVHVGMAMPMNSPVGTGLRSLPTINRVLESVLVPSGSWSQFSLGLYEDWISANYVKVPGKTQEILYFGPHFAVFSPSRFYWPGTDPQTYGITRSAADIADNIGRSVDVCWMQKTVGGSVSKARGGECDFMTNYGALTSPFPSVDARTLFNGIHREFYFNNTVIVNPVGATGGVTL